MQADLEIPKNLYPSKASESQPREALRQTELDAVLAACRKDIEASWADFEKGRMLIAQGENAIVEDVRRGNIDLRDFGILLAFLAHHHRSLMPRRPVPDAEGNSCWLLAQAIRRHGGNQRISRFLHATAETLIPYMIAIAAQTFANPEALRCFSRDCLSEHVFLDGRVLVTWGKGRSNTVQRRSFLRNRSLSVPNLIDRVMAMTAPLVSHCPPSDREYLFVTAGVLSDRHVRLIPSWTVTRHVHRFAERHDLRNLEGKPLDLTLASLRATGLTLAHAALGGDVTKTQALANHAVPDQTRHYINQPTTHADQLAALAHLQGRFVEAVRSGSVDGEERQAVHGEGSNFAYGGHSLNASASGFLCADPLGGIAPGQRKGRLCTAWLACFTCPNAVIPLDADTLARLLRTREALVEARSTMVSDRWMLLYAPKLEILERDVLPRFSTELHAAARANHDEACFTGPIE
ncbi:hypothetical protein AA0311_2679 [Asaia bogorensis NBRC 16594]|nr:hypothetical protein AA0311_2679 [Asaia bogorensis NBRC 16594]